MAVSKGRLGTLPRGEPWSIPLMKEKPRLLKRLDHIAPMTPITEEFNPPKRKPKKTIQIEPPPQPNQEDFEYIHYAPYHDQMPFKDNNTPRWHPHDVNDVVSHYLMASAHDPHPSSLGPRTCACCSDMNRENRRRRPPGFHHEPLIKDVSFLTQSPRFTTKSSMGENTEYLLTDSLRPGYSTKSETRVEPGAPRLGSPELASRSRHVPLSDNWVKSPTLTKPFLEPITSPSPLPTFSLDGLGETDKNSLFTADIFPKHPQRAPRNRTPTQPARTLPTLPIGRPGGLLEPDNPYDPKDYRQMHLTKEKRGEVLAAGGYDTKYMEQTPRGEITDDVVDASTRYHRAMEKLNRQINGLKVPNEKTMIDQL